MEEFEVFFFFIKTSKFGIRGKKTSYMFTLLINATKATVCRKRQNGRSTAYIMEDREPLAPSTEVAERK